jgi:hypothetical protein
MPDMLLLAAIALMNGAAFDTAQRAPPMCASCSIIGKAAATGTERSYATGNLIETAQTCSADH